MRLKTVQSEVTHEIKAKMFEVSADDAEFLHQQKLDQCRFLSAEFK